MGEFEVAIREPDKIQSSSLPTNTPSINWTPAQRLAALCESYALKDQDLNAWCREKGLFEHQLRQWHDEFSQFGKFHIHPADSALRQVKLKNDQLERELRRKDKALAETAALLVLQKKFQTLWEVVEK